MSAVTCGQKLQWFMGVCVAPARGKQPEQVVTMLR